MDMIKVGRAIAFLRKKNGYTQKELALRLGVSDKAVSKWERGLGLPDTGIIGKIAIILDSDTDSLLSGDIVHNNSGWSGLLILPENEQGINLSTILYDKPAAYFMLGYFMLMGIKDIRVVCSEADIKYLKKEFNNGDRIGVRLDCRRELCIEEYRQKQGNVMIVSGITFIYGVDQTRFFQKAMLHQERSVVLSLPKRTGGAVEKLYYNSDKRIVRSEDGEKLRTQYEYSPLPFYFCPAYKVSELNIGRSSEVNLLFNSNDELYTVILDRGFIDITVKTWDDVMAVSSFIKIVQKACGMQIYCIEEIAWRRGMISREMLKARGMEMKHVPYGKYILEIVE